MIELSEVNNIKDIDAIETLAREILPEVYHGIVPKEHINYLIESMHSVKAINANYIDEVNHYYLLNYNKLHIGYLHLEIQEDAIFLQKIYIQKGYRKKHIGSTAIAFTNQFAKKRGKKRIFLTVHEQLPNTIAFYKNHGFKIIKKLHHTFENGHTLSGYKMSKNLLM